jgi:putative hydrolase of the HAD superfamily
LIQYWLSKDLNWYPGVLNVAADLKAAGHSLYIATNQDILRSNFIRRQAEVGTVFKHVFTSSDLGICKPNPAFYCQIIERFFADSADGLIVIDDDYRNIAAAEQNNFKGLCFNPDLEPLHNAEHLRAALINLL